MSAAPAYLQKCISVIKVLQRLSHTIVSPSVAYSSACVFRANPNFKVSVTGCDRQHSPTPMGLFIHLHPLRVSKPKVALELLGFSLLQGQLRTLLRGRLRTLLRGRL